jgi:GT2 family glycosyltransferase
MKITVIIPTCHRNVDLAKCLECLSPGVQTLDPAGYDVIVSDDGVDTTAKEMIRTRYPWARWTQGPRRGPAANRNHGAELATSDWLAFTDDDCQPTKGWLAAFNAASSTADVLEGMTRPDRERRSYAEEAPVNLTGGCLWSCNFAIRKEVFEKIGGFDETFPAPAMEDCDFRERIRAFGFACPFLPQAEVVHPWRQAKSWAFWESHHTSFLHFKSKWSKSGRFGTAALYMRIFVSDLGRFFKSFCCPPSYGRSYLLKHLIWLLATSIRVIFIGK